MRLVTLAIASTAIALIALPATQAPALAHAAQTEAAPDRAATLTITFTGYSTAEGKILLGIYDEAGWNGGEPVRGGTVDLAVGKTTITIEGLPVGRYGIKAIHDANGNGEMDMNPFGMPTEAFAFSNNAVASMGPATWADAAFELTSSGAEQTLTIR